MEDAALESICGALGSPTRVLALALLRNQSLPAAELRQKLECSKSSLSQHMTKLKAAKLITETRDSREVTYSAPPWARDLVQQILIARQEHKKSLAIVAEKAVATCSGQVVSQAE